jgi:hypothetical protein
MYHILSKLLEYIEFVYTYTPVKHPFLKLRNTSIQLWKHGMTELMNIKNYHQHTHTHTHKYEHIYIIHVSKGGISMNPKMWHLSFSVILSYKLFGNIIASKVKNCSVTVKIWLSSHCPQISLDTVQPLIISAYLYYLSFSSPLRCKLPGLERAFVWLNV